MSLLPSSTRRPSPLRDVDYDHEINLIDHTRSYYASPKSSLGVVSDSSSRRHSDTPLRKTHSLREELKKLKYSKYQDRHLGVAEDRQAEESGTGEEPSERGRTRDSASRNDKQHKEPESAIDILYENQRGWFLCGIQLFSGRALGNLDPAPWTNVAQKTSATNIKNAQVPDPSWEWAWKDWVVNHQEGVDGDGWEYSFAFHKFSWHGPSWWNSFVRRRAWIRKRVRKHSSYQSQEDHMLSSDYFTIHPAQERSRSRASTRDGSAQNRHSVNQISRREVEEDVVMDDIHDIAGLMSALKFSRIDREKMEAIENFIEHDGDELYFLRDRVHEIMGMFIFQASRRLLLSHLSRIFNEAVEEQKRDADSGKEPDPAKKRRLENLEAVLGHADEEVRRLEFWSDIKDIAEQGEAKGAVDERQGWDNTWVGLDLSAPEDVITDKGLPGAADCRKREGNGTAISYTKTDKGKGRAN